MNKHTARKGVMGALRRKKEEEEGKNKVLKIPHKIHGALRSETLYFAIFFRPLLSTGQNSFLEDSEAVKPVFVCFRWVLPLQMFFSAGSKNTILFVCFRIGIFLKTETKNKDKTTKKQKQKQNLTRLDLF